MNCNVKRWVYFTSLVTVLTFAGCAATAVAPQLPAYVPASMPSKIEDRATLPAKTGVPTSVAKGAMAPFTGVLIDTYSAAKYKLIQTERDTLYELIQIDRAAFAKTSALSQGLVQQLYEMSKRSWWENNKGTLGFAGGMLIGMGLAILAVFGVSRVQP